MCGDENNAVKNKKERSTYVEESNQGKKQRSGEGIYGLEGNFREGQVCNSRKELQGCLYM
jgi:hypothetical protein